MSSSTRTRKRLGQHFLIDRNAVERIVRVLAPSRGEALLEIGPGGGALTSALIEQIGSIAAVEVDRHLAEALERRFGTDALLLYREDVLRLDLAEVARALKGDERSGLVVVGNLPYSISKPVAMLMVAQRSVVDRAVLMFQREVARRLTAGCGERDYGPLGILVGFAYEVTLVFDVHPGAFRPRPAVVSSVTHWARRPASFLDRGEAALRGCLRASFGSPRRTLFNNLRAAIGSATEAEALLRATGLDGRKRPGAVPPEGYLRLAEHWPAASGGGDCPSPRGAES